MSLSDIERKRCERALNADVSLYRRPTPATGACNAVSGDLAYFDR